MATEVREHSRYSPSQADRFFFCTGSRALIERMPARVSGSHADEGTEAHELLELTLSNGFLDAYQTIKELKLGYKSNDMIVAVNDAVAYIHSLYDELNSLFGDAKMYVEVFVDPPCPAAPGEAAGYVDVAIISEAGGQVYVIDYKHGVGIFKAAEGNKQVTQYAAGLLFGPDKFVDVDAIDTVTLVIIQPRSFHVQGEIREYDLTPNDVRNYLTELNERVAECESDSAVLSPEYDRCRMCPAAHSCPALMSSSLSVINPELTDIRQVNEPNLPDYTTFDAERLAYVLSASAMLKTWLKDVEKFAYEQAKGGHPPPGYKLVNSSERRFWHGEPDKIAPRLASLIGCPPDDLYDKSFIGITEAEKRVKHAFKKRVSKSKRKKAAEDAAKAFAYFTTKQASGNYSLVPVDDPRPAVNSSEHVFGDVAMRLIEPPQKEK